MHHWTDPPLARLVEIRAEHRPAVGIDTNLLRQGDIVAAKRDVLTRQIGRKCTAGLRAQPKDRKLG